MGMTTNARLNMLIDRAGLLITAMVFSFIAYWMFRLAGEYVFLAMNVIFYYALIKRAGPPKFGRKKEQSEISGADHE